MKGKDDKIKKRKKKKKQKKNSKIHDDSIDEAYQMVKNEASLLETKQKKRNKKKKKKTKQENDGSNMIVDDDSHLKQNNRISDLRNPGKEKCKKKKKKTKEKESLPFSGGYDSNSAWRLYSGLMSTPEEDFSEVSSWSSDNEDREESSLLSSRFSWEKVRREEDAAGKWLFMISCWLLNVICCCFCQPS